MGIEVMLVRELPIGGEGFVSRVALCDQEEGDSLNLRLRHIVHGAAGGEADVPILRTAEGFVVWLPADFEAKGQPHQGEELAIVAEGDINDLPPAAARYWREKKPPLET